MITLTQLTQDLQIGKSKLYRLMKELEINPHQDGRRRLLDEEQFEKSSKQFPPKKTTPTTKAAKASRSRIDSTNHALQEELLSLKKQVEELTLEKSELLKTLELRRRSLSAQSK